MFPREGGDPDWAPAFAGEHDTGAVRGLSSSAVVTHAELPPPTTTPAKAGAQLERWQ